MGNRPHRARSKLFDRDAREATPRSGRWGDFRLSHRRQRTNRCDDRPGRAAFGARAITLRYRVDLARGARFIADESPNEAATVSLYFQQRDDNWSARGRYGSYRWYAPVRAVVPLASGLFQMTVRLDETWTNVNGQPVSQNRDGFDAALRDTVRIGLAFGSSSKRSHGVYATGPARFTLLNFKIE